VTTEGERLATLEALLWEIRDDVTEVKKEAERTRDRLHKLEGISSSFLAWQKQARADEAAQYRRLGMRIQVLTVVVGVAAV
jgi:hypothetical protein